MQPGQGQVTLRDDYVSCMASTIVCMKYQTVLSFVWPRGPSITLSRTALKNEWLLVLPNIKRHEPNALRQTRADFYWLAVDRTVPHQLPSFSLLDKTHFRSLHTRGRVYCSGFGDRSSQSNSVRHFTSLLT